MHHLRILQKVVFLASKTLLSPTSTRKKTFSSTLNFMILEMVTNKYAKLSTHIDRQVNYKILQLEVPNNPETLHNPPCFW
jgi:hypothetical protein